MFLPRTVFDKFAFAPLQLQAKPQKKKPLELQFAIMALANLVRRLLLDVVCRGACWGATQ